MMKKFLLVLESVPEELILIPKILFDTGAVNTGYDETGEKE